jgi:hypothetical protein
MNFREFCDVVDNDLFLIDFDYKALKSEIEKADNQRASRSPVEIVESAKKEFSEAFKNLKYINTKDIKEFDGKFMLAESAPLSAKSKSILNEDALKKEFVTQARNALLVYSFCFGSYSENRAWIRINSDTFIKLDKLCKVGSRQVLTTVFSKQIRNLIAQGNKNYLIKSLEGKVKIHPTREQFLFSKGYYAFDDLEKNKIAAVAIQKDLKTIFDWLTEKPQKNVVPNLLFFNMNEFKENRTSPKSIIVEKDKEKPKIEVKKKIEEAKEKEKEDVDSYEF